MARSTDADPTPLIGRRFGARTVIAIEPGTPNPRLRITLRCDCGREMTICYATLLHTHPKGCKSCSARTHGHAPTQNPSPEYTTWSNLWTRCTNPARIGYSRYGARGITVCERWKSFDCFLADMGLRPTPKHSLDRIDNDGPYSPENCRWATRAEQSSNTSQVRFLTFNGKTMTHREWEEEIGIPRGTLGVRLRNGWSVERALTRGNQRIHYITHNGETLSLSAWSLRLSGSIGLVHTRLEMGWSPERAVTTPARPTKPYRPRKSVARKT
jgi:hypothetical protein